MDRRLSVASLVHHQDDSCSTTSTSSPTTPTSTSSALRKSSISSSGGSVTSGRRKDGRSASTGFSSTSSTSSSAGSTSSSPALSRSGLPPQFNESSMQASASSPLPQRFAIDTQDEDVLMVVRALGDMRGTGLVGHTPRSTIAYWDTATVGEYNIISNILVLIATPGGTSAQPTPSLSIASTSQVTSPSIMTHNLDEEDEDEDVSRTTQGEPNDDFVSRVSHIPIVNAAVRAYDYSKANSRVVKVSFRIFLNFASTRSPAFSENER
jgi:hypothetical protein